MSAPVPSQMQDHTPHVVVIGGGPVGLSAALLLDRHGVNSTVVEKDSVPSNHPKARGMRPRTMELFMQWGLAGELYRQALPPEANRFIYCESLAGAEYGRSPEMDVAPSESVSRASICRVAQSSAQEVLRRAVSRSTSVDLRLGAEALATVDHGDFVEVTLADGQRIRADYVIAADGASSGIRRSLGVDMEGAPVQGYGQSIFWRGDLSRWTEDRMCIQFVTGQRGDRPSNIASVDGRELWITMVMQPGTAERPTPPTASQAIAIIHRAVGAAVDVEILDITTWRISARVATRWRVGRVFLAGDAAHSFPPTGGFGMNTGVQDVHNLVWKLAAVLGGRAGDALLDSYEAERIDIARSNAQWSTANGQRFKDINAAVVAGDQQKLEQLLAEQAGHVDATSQDLAFGYRTGAITGSEQGSGSPLRHPRLGHRFPEAVLQMEGTSMSSNTELGDHFTLVVREKERWREDAATLGNSAPSMTIACADQHVLGDAHAVLIRPDGIVGWIGDDRADHGDALAALGEIMCVTK